MGSLALVQQWRKAMLDPGWPSDGGESARLTMVDFSSELFGLSTLWLGADFFRRHTSYFNSTSEGGEVVAAAPMVEAA